MISITDYILEVQFFLALKCWAKALIFSLSLNLPETLLPSKTAFVSELSVRPLYAKVSHIFTLA